MPQRVNIIHAEDEALFRQGFAALLKGTDINIIGQASDGKELFALLKTKKPDVVILDLEMPVLNGSKALVKLKKDYPNIRVIIMSRYYDENLIKDMFNRGASAYLSKNKDASLLFDCIRRVHAYGTYKDNIPCLLQNPAIKDSHYYKLVYTKSETKIMGFLLNTDLSYKEIACKLNIAKRTVENQADSIFKKAGVTGRVAFVQAAVKLGLHFLTECQQ